MLCGSAKPCGFSMVKVTFLGLARRSFAAMALSPAMQKHWNGERPVFFGPCTPHGKPGRAGRTWGTRPEKGAGFYNSMRAAN